MVYFKDLVMRAATRHTFGSLLKQSRKRRSMSQLDLALAADVSARHICFLETGRSSPSRQMVMRLADTPHFGMRDSNQILLAAGFSPTFRETALDHESMRLVQRALDRILCAHEPYPAFVLDRVWNVVCGNQAHWQMLDVLLEDASPGEEPVNVLRLIFDPKWLRPRIRNWSAVVHVLWHRLRQQTFMAGPEDELHELFEQLSELPDVRDVAEQRSPQPDEALLVPLQIVMGDRVLSWFSTIATIGTPLDITLEELRIETMFPADEATERFAREFASNQGPASAHSISAAESRPSGRSIQSAKLRARRP